MPGRSQPSVPNNLSSPCRVLDIAVIGFVFASKRNLGYCTRVRRTRASSGMTYLTVDITGTARLLRRINANQFITPRAPSVPRDAHAAPCHEYRGTK
jgi:hypothetical protein